MADDNGVTRSNGLKIILFIFFISAFLTIIVFMVGEGWFNVFIEKLNRPYETLEMVRSVLVKVFMGTAITSFATSITAVILLIIRS